MHMHILKLRLVITSDRAGFKFMFVSSDVQIKHWCEL